MEITPCQPKEDDTLCCCEYIDENGERSHILATLCNCDAIDEAFERLVSWEGTRPGLSTEVTNAIEDRLRIPWPGGARKFSCPIILPLTLNPIIILLGGINHILTFVTYILLLPAVMGCCHKAMKRRRKRGNVDIKSSEIWEGNCNDFYTFWLASTVAYLMAIYYTQVIASLKISSFENLTFVVLFVCTWVCLFIVVKKGKQSIRENRNRSSSNTLDILPSLNMCSKGCFKASQDSRHCNICDACFSRRDHHCLWLNTCIARVNDRWFVSGLVLALSCLLYGTQLTFTTLCHPRLINLYFFEVLYPDQCPNAYSDLSSSLMLSGGCYALVLIGCVTLVLIQQVYIISRGLRRPKKNRLSRASALYRVCVNWHQFWMQ